MRRAAPVLGLLTRLSRTVTGRLAAAGLAVVIHCGVAAGQDGAAPAKAPPPDTATTGPSATPPEERRPPAPEYTLAALSTILLLVIVCSPSRKVS